MSHFGNTRFLLCLEIPDADWLSSGVCLEALHDGQTALWFAYSTMLLFFVDISLLQVQISTKKISMVKQL